jgi:hypothetical protein
MKLKHLHLHAHFRAIYMATALFAAPLSMEVYGQTYSVVFSNSSSFDKKVEVPMAAALYRDDKAVNLRHTKDNNRWQISLKYDDPRWKDILDGTVYWYIKSGEGALSAPAPMLKIWMTAMTTAVALPLSMAVCFIRMRLR